VENINYITGKQKHKDNGHKASFENSTEENTVSPCITKKSVRTITKIKTIPINNATSYELDDRGVGV
jgi:hypothetical protein